LRGPFSPMSTFTLRFTGLGPGLPAPVPHRSCREHRRHAGARRQAQVRAAGCGCGQSLAEHGQGGSDRVVRPSPEWGLVRWMRASQERGEIREGSRSGALDITVRRNPTTDPKNAMTQSAGLAIIGGLDFWIWNKLCFKRNGIDEDTGCSLGYGWRAGGYG
jgi:hypothetical protein